MSANGTTTENRTARLKRLDAEIHRLEDERAELLGPRPYIDALREIGQIVHPVEPWDKPDKAHANQMLQQIKAIVVDVLKGARA